MQPSALSLIPPAITLALIFLTRRTISSIVAGMLTAGLIVTGGSPLQAIKLCFFKVMQTSQLHGLVLWQEGAEFDKLFLLSFILILSFLISLLTKSGVASSYAGVLGEKIKTKKGAETFSIGLSLLLFIDDYLNSMTTSKISSLITDRLKVSRLKLSFLITAFAAPLCSLAPISSWGAAIVSFIATGGISDRAGGLIAVDPFLTFCGAVPFVFFSLLLVFTTIWMTRKGLSFGQIRLHEQIADSTNNLFGKAEKVTEKKEVEEKNQHSLFFFLGPVLTLIFSVVIGLLSTGGFWLFGGKKTFMQSLTNTNPELALVSSAALVFLFWVLVFVFAKKIKVQDVFEVLVDGFNEIKDIILLLLMAWTLAEFLKDDLQTGVYVASSMMPVVGVKSFPAVVFALASVISFSVGSSWATMSIMFPMVVPMTVTLLQSNPQIGLSMVPVFLSIGAILSGVIFGSSLSPTSDLILMTSKNTGVRHTDYLAAQFEYLWPLGLGSFVAFVFGGVLSSLSFSYQVTLISSLLLGFALSWGIIYFLHKAAHEKI